MISGEAPAGGRPPAGPRCGRLFFIGFIGNGYNLLEPLHLLGFRQPLPRAAVPGVMDGPNHYPFIYQRITHMEWQRSAPFRRREGVRGDLFPIEVTSIH